MGWLSNLIAKIKKPINTVQDLRDRVTNCPFMSDKDKKALLKVIDKYLS